MTSPTSAPVRFTGGHLVPSTGAAGSGAKNLTCEIREARYLSCEWQVGPAAPADVRYSLRVLNSTCVVMTSLMTSRAVGGLVISR